MKSEVNEMTDVKFIKICKEVVKNYANEHHFLMIMYNIKVI